MQAKFFIVGYEGYIIPVEYNSYENACANCDSDEMVFLSSSLEELEACLEDLTAI